MLGFGGLIISIFLLVYIIGFINGNVLKVVYAIAVLFMACGILLKIMHWAGAKELIITGSVVSFLIVGYSYIQKQPKTLEHSTLVAWFLFMLTLNLEVLDGSAWKFWVVVLRSSFLVISLLFIAIKHFSSEEA